MVTPDPQFIFIWWFLLSLIGIVNIPLCWFFFKKFSDIGYGFAKTIGIVAISYIIFLASTLHILKFNGLSLYFIFGLLSCLNLSIFLKNKDELLTSIRKNFKVILFQEILFASGLLLWSYVRAHQPDINGLEKFMDYGFINSILRSQYLPPADMWYTGSPINYYWFGHLVTAVLTKLTNIPVAVVYNLMLATILGLTATGAFSISSTLAKALKPKINKRAIFAAGILSAILLTFAGNFHTPIYVIKKGADKYWYPDATRFIGYNPETNDKTIHEFPIYSFVVSDLHPHLLNLPFVLLFLGFLLRIVTKKTFSYKDLFPLGFLLGIFFMTNTWDFGNYLVVSGFVFLLFNLGKTKNIFDSLFKTALSATLIIVIGILTSLPFIINFDSIAQGIDFVKARTPIWQLGVLWGFPAILTYIFVFFIYIKRQIKKSDIFVISLLSASWVLIILPEVIFVKDIYIASHHRANTMFKLTYQAFVMFYLVSGYIAVRTLIWTRRKITKFLLVTFYSVIFVSILWYPRLATKSYYGDLKVYKGLDGESWLSDKHPNIHDVILWFRKNVTNQPTILEAPGDSYTEFNVISSYTGLPTVSGWFVHEWLWRGTSEIPQARVTDITQIYTSPDLQETKNLLNKYKVEYLVVGEFERQKFPNINEAKFSQLGNVVFTSGNTLIFKLN